jgi:hypothetical protein
MAPGIGTPCMHILSKLILFPLDFLGRATEEKAGIITVQMKTETFT